MNNKKCYESGQVFFGRPWFAQPDDKFYSGQRVTCSCGKQVKLRKPLTGSSVHTMIPHHNVPARKTS